MTDSRINNLVIDVAGSTFTLPDLLSDLDTDAIVVLHKVTWCLRATLTA